MTVKITITTSQGTVVEQIDVEDSRRRGNMGSVVLNNDIWDAIERARKIADDEKAEQPNSRKRFGPVWDEIARLVKDQYDDPADMEPLDVVDTAIMLKDEFPGLTDDQALNAVRKWLDLSWSPNSKKGK